MALHQSSEQLIQCTFFPRCRHGDSCLYVHEACRFKQKCTKSGCPYVHPFKKSNNLFEEVLKNYLKGQNHQFKNQGKPNNKKHHQENQPNDKNQ